MKKFVSIALAITTTLWLFGTFYVPVAKAAVVDGDVVSPDATFVDADGNTYYPYDVFIVKIVGSKTFKRLVLNPQVFESYGHLKWENIKKISADTVKGYTTSSLVREINDTKVYKLIPDGDVGTKQWVETLDCFTSKGYDWDSVYIINATDRDNYTTGATICGGAAEGELTLSLASDTPAASTIPPNAQGVTFVKVNVAGSGTISQVVFKRLGAGDVNDFGDLYVYENGTRLTSGRSISSATSKVTFIGLKIKAPTTFELVADMSTGTAGNINYFAIEAASDVTADATVGGTFPLNGNPMGISGTNAGTITVERSGTTSRNVTIGSKEVEITQFKITTATEGANLYRVELFDSGTGETTKITNLKLKDNAGNTLATADKILDSGYVTFNLTTPFYIKKGDNHIFRVYADIGGVKPDQTILLYLELSTDILAKGTTYGYGMAATITSFDSDTYITVTCKGGDLTLNKIGPNATKIGTTTQDTNFLEFTMSAAADITIKRTRLFFCLDHEGDGTYYDWDNTASTSAGADVEDIKIRDKNSGVILAGPKDGTSFNDGEVDNGCPSNTDGIYEDYTDTIDLSAGDSDTLQITADIKTSNTDSGAVIASSSRIKFYLYSYATLVGTSGNVNYMKYAGTTDAVDDSAIAPSGHIAGEEMTVEGASLSLALAATPSGSSGTSPADNKTYIKGQSGVEAVGIIFEAGKASDITVSAITLTGYISEEGGNAGEWLSGQDANHYVKDTVAKVYIYDKSAGTLVPGSAGKAFSGSTYELVEYTGLNWTIPAGETKTLLVKVDLSSAAPASASTADTFIALDIEGTSDVTSIDKDGNSVTIGSAGKNGGNATDASVNPNTDFGVAKYGSLAVAAASDTPDKSIAVMGTADNEVSKFKLTGTNEAWYIEKFSVVLDDGQGVDSTNRDNFTAVKLKYQTETQWGTSNWTISSGKTFGANASLAFSFTGSDRIYVPKDDSSYLTVLVSIGEYLGGTGAKSKVPFKIYTISGSSDSFLTYGAQSGEQVTSFTEPAGSGFNLHFVARSKPVFAKSAWSGGELELARFTITAVGYDVVFDGDDDNYALTEAASACLNFDIIASSTDDATGTLTVYDWNENIVASRTAITWGAGAGTSTSFLFEVRDTTVPKDTTKEFHVDLSGADLADFQKTDEYLYLQLKSDDGGNLATGSMGAGQRNIVYEDGTNEEGISGEGDPEERFGVPALIKNIGPLPITFRTLRGTATP